MSGRSTHGAAVLGALLGALVLSGCQSEMATGPRIISLIFVSGAGQVDTIGLTLGQPYVVRAQDQAGAPIVGVTVNWTVTNGDGVVTPSQSTTGSDGTASTIYRLGEVVGDQSVSATVNGVAPISFTSTGLARAAPDDSTTTPPPPAPLVVQFATIEAGERHTCALSTDDVNFCWGYNGDGQLGIGEDPKGSGPVFAFPQPVMAVGNLTFRQAIGSRFHTCALTLSGIGYCWGTNLDGRLGTNNVVPKTIPSQVVTSTSFRDISPGRVHTCGLSLANRVFCWGYTRDGAIGIGPPVVDSILFPLEVSGAQMYQSLSAGRLHTCAVTTAGAGFCWGDNQSGQLGDGTTTQAFVPVAVTGALVLSSVSSGGAHTCGLTTGGAAFCWGSNAQGQLGDGTNVSSSIPVSVGGGLLFTSLSAGLNHTCGVAAGNQVFCWGDNSSGQLGTGTLSAATTPTPLGGGVSMRTVSAAATNSCGMGTDGFAYCWGDNKYGQLGDGSQVNHLLPTRVALQP